MPLGQGQGGPDQAGSLAAPTWHAGRPPAYNALLDWIQPFTRTIHQSPNYVSSMMLKNGDWNAELLGGDVRGAVRELKIEVLPD